MRINAAMDFPNASRAFRELNPHLSGGRRVAKLEQGTGGKPLEARKAKEKNTQRYFIRVESVRKRLCDPDNLCCKYHIDALRYARIIPDDCPEIIDFKPMQRKCEKGETEKTIIEITTL